MFNWDIYNPVRLAENLLSIYLLNYHYFRFAIGWRRRAIKRESGVNPELSRSCKKLHQTGETTYLSKSLSRHGRDGKTGKLGFKSEDLPTVIIYKGFRGMKLRY